MSKHAKGRNISYDELTDKFTSIGKYYNEKIIRLLLAEPGLAPRQIGKRLHIHRVSASRHLSDLKRKNMIYNIRNKYYPSHLALNQIYWFASKMDLNSSGLALSFKAVDENNCHHHLPSNSSYYTTPMGVLESRTMGSSPSSAFCKTKFTDRDTNEKYLFEFVNRIGAYIAYIFMQSMMPFSLYDPTKPEKQRISERVEILIQNAIDLGSWYQHFCEIFRSTILTNYRGSVSDNTDAVKNVCCHELDQEHFDIFSRVFDNVYPGIYEGLEASWSKVVEDTVKIQQHFASKIEKSVIKDVKCDHSWKETKIYKYPKKCYLCTKCKSLSHSNSKPCPEPENMPIELVNMSNRSEVQLSRNITSSGDRIKQSR